ncbi:hypothetical protein M9H77_00473 [Catharanthus roseus]|nr:hypothetical protein M9H77_00473 [Catharanthus roseus]
MIVGEIFLSAFISALFQRLAAVDLRKLKREESDSKLRKEKIDYVRRGDRDEKIFVGDYELDDMVDELTSEALRRKSTESQAYTNKFTSKIKDLNEQLDSLVEQISILNLVQRPNTTRESLHTTSLVNESGILGREKDREGLLEFLLQDVSFDAQVSVISVVGMAGVGKTTLARLVYNDERINSLFDLKAWVELKKHLSGKKFLIVLDDVWNEKHEELDTLLYPLMVGLRGSKILATTRDKRVAKAMSSAAIGRSIVRKCENLPLAIKTLGRLLSTKQSLAEWKDVLNNEIWDLPNTQRDILPALLLSYHHLPSHLKRCFAYCAIFPKGYQIDKQELVLLWMAEGLLQLTTGKGLMEDLGRDYLMNYYQDVDNSCFVMHDLINDLAKYVAGKMYFTLEDQLDHQENSIFSGVIICHMLTIHLVSSQGFNSSTIVKLPSSVGNLKHLRYLNLSETSLKFLPGSICLLYNLQTLSVRNCHKLLSLPPGLTSLVNLRHLDNANTDCLQEMPLGIGQLTSLQTLSKLVVSKGSGLMPIEVGNLSLLRGSLSFDNLQNVMKLEGARGAKLKSKPNINELKLVWSKNFDDSRDGNFELHVLDVLEPSKDLKILNIDFYGGVKFSSWLGKTTFSKLSLITINGCMKCESLPPLGQLPSLKDLSIRGMHCLKFLGSEFYGESSSSDSCFPLLETLRFEDMPNWKNGLA